MKRKISHPGVYIPPPVIGLLVFLWSLFMQRTWPLRVPFLASSLFVVAGWVLIGFALCVGLAGVKKFWSTGNTVETFKPATSLQTTGIYKVSRNPMYVGLVAFYLGFSLVYGKMWSLLSVVIFIIILQEYVIRREERYLKSEFGSAYLEYKGKVRRWLGKK